MLTKISADCYSLKSQKAVFLINNLAFIEHQSKQIKSHPVLEADIKLIQTQLEESIQKYIAETLQESFAPMCQALSQENASK
jgi:hypothetical protein